MERHRSRTQDALNGGSMQEERKTQAKGWYETGIRQTLVPVILMLTTPNIAVCITYLVVARGSSCGPVFREGLYSFWLASWKAAVPIDPEAWLAVLAMATWAAASVICLGGKKYYGPPTASGHRPQYTMSGFRYYLITVAGVGALTLIFPNSFSAWYWYQKMIPIAGVLNTAAFTFCSFLYVKGRLWPSAGEHGSSGNILFDFYWGLELYPRLGRHFDVKLWTNARFGMMVWQLVVLLCWKARLEQFGWSWSVTVNCVLQTVYIGKFFWWEHGYMRTLDIILDRAGFYICWGCICFVPTFYTLSSLYLVENAPSISAGLATLIMAAGVTAVVLTYWVDYQRLLVLETKGECKIWGKPPRLIHASYQDSAGQRRNSLLLASGFWGWSRHSNYLFEVMATFSWQIPALTTSLLPYCHGVFLFCLLLHRTLRDEAKCSRKYGKYWKEYCAVSRYRFIPYVF